MVNNVASLTRRDTIDLLYGQLLKVVISHPVMACIISLWFLNITTSIFELYLWVGAICALAVIRFSLSFAYRNYRKTHQSNPSLTLWLHLWVGLSVLQGSIYSFGFLYFVPPAETLYVVSVGLFIVVISAPSIIGTLSSRYALSCAVMPLILPSVVYFGMHSGHIGLLMASTVTFYCLVAVVLALNLHKVFSKSLVQNYQHKQEIDKRKQAEHQLLLISRKDGLTNLYNRRYFNEVLETEIGRAQRNHAPLCLLMIDIDYFKLYNDQYGHIEGDTCLIQISDILTNLTSRNGDLVARYGGEEFAIILPNIELQGAVSFANKIQDSIQKAKIEHIASKLTTLKCVTVSIGVTNLQPFKKMNGQQLLEVSDRALYTAKKMGRNRVHFIDSIGVHN